VSPVRYELGFYIPEDGVLRSHHRRGNLRSYTILYGMNIVFRYAFPSLSGCLLFEV
jgi:hypothetical protein